MRLKSIAMFLLLLLFSTKTLSQITSVEKFQLDNGLRVILNQDSKIPLYSLHLWYDVGSSDENPNLTGLAHFFEHLMFKGTSNYGDGYFDNYIENNGGSNNAFTNYNITGYHENMPASTLETILKLEADRMLNLEVSLKNVNQEREVVKEERRLLVENSPMGLAYEAIFRNAFSKSSPYSWPVIGSMKHLEKATIKDFKDFYKRFYIPNNAVLVISGKFKTKEVKKWINQYFAPLKKGLLNKKEIKSTYQKNTYQKINKKVNSKSLLYAFPGSSPGATDEITLSLVSTMLSRGESSYLYQELVEGDKSFLSAGVSSYPLPGGGLNFASASLKPGRSAALANKTFKKVLKLKVKTGFNEDELNRGKKFMKISFYNQFKTINSKAKHLARAEIVHKNYAHHFNDINKIEAITLKQVNKTLREYYKVDEFNFIEVGL